MGRKRKRHKASEHPQTPSQPAQAEDAQQTGDTGAEAAPTDYRRNVWLMVVILAVVAAAWLANVAAKSGLFRPPAP